jgi:ATP-dependent exoDNAse (exonuclease V) alpha subunit
VSVSGAPMSANLFGMFLVESRKVANRELGRVEGIGEHGRLSLKMDGGRAVELDSAQHPHLDHGYAVTSHSSQVRPPTGC